MKILKVCLGNICRSPLAEGIARQLATQRGLDWDFDSAGTAGWHEGSPPDARSTQAARHREIDISNQTARKISQKDIMESDLIIAMDAQNLRDLRAVQPAGSSAKLAKLMDYAPELGISDVPDPYYEDNFPEVLDMIETACLGLREALS